MHHQDPSNHPLGSYESGGLNRSTWRNRYRNDHFRLCLSVSALDTITSIMRLHERCIYLQALSMLKPTGSVNVTIEWYIVKKMFEERQSRRE